MAANPRRQHGIVLIMSLVMLVIVALLATATMKNALSSESVSGNVRLQQLAHQSAEIALRFCEDAVIKAIAGSAPSGFSIQAYSTSPLGSSTTFWDSANSDGLYVLSLDIVNADGKPYKRSPECVAERLAPAGSPRVDELIVVTARGFGPEVASLDADAGDRRPKGSEVFLQSTLELN